MNTAATQRTAATGSGSVFARMAQLLDIRLVSEADAIRIVATGLTTHSYRRALRKLRFAPSLVAPESTIRRRLATGSRFSEAESERLLRIVRVYAEAAGLFGDDAAALKWMTTPGKYLQGEDPIAPMQLAATDSGARLMESRIRRTAHGVF